jgi:nitrite reductase/ring-hydroxylating ferredoxin subunit
LSAATEHGGGQLIAGAAQLAEGERLLATVEGREIGVFRIHGELRAWENRCPHQGGPVCTGLLVGRTELVLADDMTVVREERSDEVIHIACPWHGWEFDIDSGVCWALPAARLRAVDIHEHDGEVYARRRAGDGG